MISNYKKEIQLEHYKTFNDRARYFKEIYKSFDIKPKEKVRYLDIGCGSGHNTLEFSQEFREIYGLEYNGKDLGKFKIKDSKRKLKFIQGDARSLKFKNEFFDLITLFSVIEHIPETDKVIQELNRVLKRRGILIFQIPNRYFILELHTYLPLLYLLPRFIRDRLLKQMGYSDDAIFASRLSKSQVVKELKKNKLKFKIKNMIYPEKLFPKRFVWAYKLLKTIGIFNIIPFGYFIVCQKGDKK